MSMELWIFSDRQLNSMADWQAAIDAEGYPLKLSDATPLKNLKGFLPAQLRGEPAGFECYHDDAADLMRRNPDISLGHAWRFVLGFRWVGSSLEELRAAWMAATAYAVATDGMIFDDQEGKLRNGTEAREVVHGVERDVPDMDWVADEVLRDLKLGPYGES
jgi:hypothetical protein